MCLSDTPFLFCVLDLHWMEKNTVRATKLIACDTISITAVAAFRNKVFVAGYGDKLFVYYLSTGTILIRSVNV